MWLIALPQELRCVEEILQNYVLITSFCWGYPLWNKRMKRELLDGRILFRKDSIDFLFLSLRQTVTLCKIKAKTLNRAWQQKLNRITKAGYKKFLQPRLCTYLQHSINTLFSLDP